MKTIKLSRLMLMAGFAHFTLWWLYQAVVHFSHFTPYTNMPEYSSPYGHMAFALQMMLTFPFQMVGFYPEAHQLQTYLFVALDSCVWGLCLGGLVFGARQTWRGSTVKRS